MIEELPNSQVLACSPLFSSLKAILVGSITQSACGCNASFVFARMGRTLTQA